MTNRIYVTNFNSGDVTVIDGADHSTGPVPSGDFPVAVAVNAKTNQVYVTNYFSANVTVIDGRDNSVADIVAVEDGPLAMAVNPVTNRVYVANGDSDNVTIIDGSDNVTATVEVGAFPSAFAVNPVTNRVYVANFLGDNVTVIDGNDHSTSTVAAGDGPIAVAVNPMTNRVYVANTSNGTVTVIDGSDNSTSTVSAGDGPVAVAVNLVTNRIYVANQRSGNVTVIDGSDNSVIDIVAVEDGPVGVAVNPVTNRVYVANFSSDNVTVIDGSDNSPTTVAAGNGPIAVAVNSITNRTYVANQLSDDVTVIDGNDNSIITTAGAGNEPRALAVNPVTNRVYVANQLSDDVTVIDGSDHTTITVDVEDEPNALAVNPVTNRVYVTSFSSDSVTLIDGTDHSSTSLFAEGAPSGVGVNPVTNQAYVSYSNSDSVMVITPNAIQSNPLTTAVTPLPGDTTMAEVTSFRFTANSAHTPTAPPVQQIYYQVDTQVGPWLRATPDGASASGNTPPLTPGIHLLFAFATDGQEATSINTGSGSSPIPGQVSAYVFLVGRGEAQVQPQADSALTLFQDPAEGATGVRPGVSRVFDSATGQDLELLLNDYQAQFNYDGSCFNVLDVREGDFDISDIIIDNTGGQATFTGTTPAGAAAPTDLSLVLTRLLGTALQICPLTLELTSLNDSDGNSIEVPDALGRDFLRGDAQVDGDVTIGDARFIAQYLLESRQACTTVIDSDCLHSVNAASVRHDGEFDRKTIADALFIAQFLQGLRDESYSAVEGQPSLVTFSLNEENNSGQSGQATLTGQNGQTEVVLTLSSGNLETELAHIHTGQCGPSLGGIVFPLTSFVDGSGESVTTVDAPLVSLLTGDFAINTHQQGQPSVFTACGDIPANP
jgi:YVTN family beta-propeller protein